MLATSSYLDIGTNLDVIRESVYRRIGYQADIEPSSRIASLVEEQLENTKYLIQSSFSCVFRSIERVQEPIVTVEDSIRFSSRIIARLLKHCHKVAVFVLTIGNKLEDKTLQLANEGLILEAYVLDAIGSSLAERMADSVQNIVDEMAQAQGFSSSRRFSPGYCDWHISQQKAVFHAMGNRFPDVKLSEDCLMVPQKSISGIIGLGPRKSNVATYNPCDTCKKYDCAGRR